MNIKVLEVNINDIGQGGGWAFIKNAINAQSTKADTEVTFDFFSLEPFEREENITFVESRGGQVIVRHTANKVIRQVKTYFDLKEVLKNSNYDIVHIHSDVAFKMFAEGLAAKHAKVPNVILHSHCSGIDRGHRIIKRIAHEMCKPFLGILGTYFFACSKKAGMWMYTKNVNKRVRVINNAVDCKKFQYNEIVRAEYRKKLDIEDEQLVIGHVGRFMFQKNHDFLISIFGELVKLNPSAKLLLIGEGELESDVHSKVNNLGLERSVFFLGVTDKVSEYMQAMDLFLLPSRFEGLPVVGIEAQAAGLPCLMSSEITQETNLFGLVEFLSLDYSPIIWAKKIVSIMNTFIRKNTLKEMIESGYDISVNDESLKDIYKQIITGEFE